MALPIVIPDWGQIFKWAQAQPDTAVVGVTNQAEHCFVVRAIRAASASAAADYRIAFDETGPGNVSLAFASLDGRDSGRVYLLPVYGVMARWFDRTFGAYTYTPVHAIELRAFIDQRLGKTRGGRR